MFSGRFCVRGHVMSCGSGDIACFLLTLLSEHGVEASHALKWLPWIEDAVREHIQALIGLAGFSFGIWKWWYYREQALHKRLAEYLADEDRRLRHARQDVLEAINRPAPSQGFAQPLFIVKGLEKVLRKRNWNRILAAPGFEIGAERQLAGALDTLHNRLEVAQGQLDRLHAQQAAAYLLRGAIASARAADTRFNGSAVKLDRKALNEFRSLLQVPGHEENLEAREYEAHQLMRLGLHQQAITAYAQLEQLAKKISSDAKLRDLAIARAKRWRAALVQALAWRDWKLGRRPGPGSGTAYALLSADTDSAISLRSGHGPYIGGWDAIDQGDLHYLTAFVAQNRSFNGAAQTHLGFAEAAYQSVISATHPLAPVFSTKSRRLEGTAQAAMKRIRRAQANADDYDLNWLLPPTEPLEQANQPAEPISSAGSHDGVAKASGENEID